MPLRDGHTGVMTDDRPVLVFANAAAGSADDADVQQALDVLREARDIDVVVPGQGESMQEAAGRAAGREIVVLGGDGSVNGCIAALDRSGTLTEVRAIGLVPLGTGNDFARTMGLPFDPAEAARVALRGAVQRVDLLHDDQGGIAVNVVHAGIAAQATANAEEVKGILGAGGYAVGALRAGVDAHGWHLRVTVDDEVVTDGDQPVLMVSVAVGRSVGGGTQIAPHASPTNGQAQVMVCTATDAAARASFALDLRRGRHTEREDVTVARGRTVTVEAVGEHPFGINTDGDLDGEHWSRSWTVQDNAWACRVPADSSGRTPA